MAAPRLVLCFSGHDPSGGAGLQADIETVAAWGGHALGLITALTVQDTQNVERVVATAPELLAEQFDVLWRDCRPQAIKVGLVGSAQQLPVIVEAVDRCRVPVICDPVLSAGGGAVLVDEPTIASLRQLLFPRVSLLTPNASEARRLSGLDDLERCAQALLADGCANVLVTGGDEPGVEVVNTWYCPGQAPRHFRWPRMTAGFHGAGCTLSSAIAVLLAQGLDWETALERAQRWTQAALRRAILIGRGRLIPNRRP
jgi:hydroxymethylpyrimidine/phosphomethylpyrimidine kinase